MKNFFNPEGKHILVNKECLSKGVFVVDTYNYLEGLYEFKPVKAVVKKNGSRVTFRVLEDEFLGDYVDYCGHWNEYSYGTVWKHLDDFETEVCQDMIAFFEHLFKKETLSNTEFVKIKDLLFELAKGDNK